MMKKLLRVLQCAVFCALLMLALSHAAGVLERKESVNKFKPFFEQKEDFDVLFLGNSHMINGVLPMELYQDYGIVSYNLAGYGNSIPLSYWVLRNALDYTTPRAVVLEIHNTRKTYKLSGSSGDEHKALDAFALSKNKYLAIEDLMSDPEAFNDDGYAYPDLKWEFYFPIGKYHSRWNDLGSSDFSPNVNQMMGAEIYEGVSDPEDYYIIDENMALSEEGYGFEYLRKFIELCQSRGIEVVLTHLPFPSNEEEQMEGNAVWYIADEYGVHYLDFVNLDQVADYRTDLFDSSHLNASGAKKATDYLGRYLAENLEIPDRRNDPQYASWHDALDRYHAIKDGRLAIQGSLESLLMLAHDKNYSTVVYIPEDSAVYRSEKIMRLLHNIPREHIFEEDMFAKWSETLYPLETLDLAAKNGQAYAAWMNAGSGEIVEYAGEEIPESIAIPQGTVNLKKESMYSLVDGDEETPLEFSAEAPGDIQILIISNVTGKPVRTAQFAM